MSSPDPPVRLKLPDPDSLRSILAPELAEISVNWPLLYVAEFALKASTSVTFATAPADITRISFTVISVIVSVPASTLKVSTPPPPVRLSFPGPPLNQLPQSDLSDQKTK